LEIYVTNEFFTACEKMLISSIKLFENLIVILLQSFSLELFQDKQSTRELAVYTNWKS